MRERIALVLVRKVALISALAFVTVTSVAGAAPSDVDLYADIGVGRTGTSARPVPNGGTVTVTALTFWAGPGVELITPKAASARIRFDLPEGLRWGTDEPDPTEGCTSTPTSGICQAVGLEPITGRTGVGWAWEIVAARAGSYILRAEIVETSEPDPDLSNNTASVTVVVTEPASGGGGGGGTASVSASAVKLSPVKPKAGSTLVASVRVTRGGSPVKPTGIACAASVGGAKIKGGAKSSSGLASCLFKTPKAGKGKTLLGSVSFNAGGQSFTKRFAARLG